MQAGGAVPLVGLVGAVGRGVAARGERHAGAVGAAVVVRRAVAVRLVGAVVAVRPPVARARRRRAAPAQPAAHRAGRARARRCTHERHTRLNMTAFNVRQHFTLILSIILIIIFI